MTAPPASAPRVSGGLLAAGGVAFLTLGVLQAMYGPSFALFSARYGVGTGDVGVIASAHFLGSALAPPLVGLALRRVSLRAAVALSLLVLAAGVLGVAFAPLWGLAVACALLGGLGLGGVSAALNAAYAALGTRAINLVNSVFGVGSMLSPLLVGALSGAGAGGHAGPFVVVAGLAALTFVAGRLWGVPAVPGDPPDLNPGRAGRQFGLFALLIAAYVGLEAGLGAWAAGYLGELGVAGAALYLSGFWAALTAGRVLTGLAGGRVPAAALVLGSAVATGACALLALMPGLAGAAVVLSGLALGPVFGTTLAWMAGALPARLVPFLMVAASAGGVLSPALIGALMDRAGAQALPLTLLALAAVMGLLSQLTARSLARA